MIGYFVRLVAVVAMATTIVASELQAQAASNDLATTGEWSPSPKGSDLGCSMETAIVGAPEQKVTVGISLGQDATSIMLEGNETSIGKRNRPQDGNVVVVPSGERFTVTVLQYIAFDTQKPVILLRDLPERFLQTFAAGNAVRLERNGQAYAQIRYSGAAEVAAKLRACGDAFLQKWGFDVKRLKSLKSKPRLLNITDIFSGADYPLTEVQNHIQGDDVIAFTVDPDGRARKCSVVVSSGSSLLDVFACHIFESRAKFLPAIEANGVAVPVRIPQVIRWKIP